MKYLLVSCGCAECRGISGDCLIEIVGIFDTLEKAKAATWMKDPTWYDNPQGGWYATSGQGDDWILPLTDSTDLKHLKIPEAESVLETEVL